MEIYERTAPPWVHLNSCAMIIVIIIVIVEAVLKENNCHENTLCHSREMNSLILTIKCWPKPKPMQPAAINKWNFICGNYALFGMFTRTAHTIQHICLKLKICYKMRWRDRPSIEIRHTGPVQMLPNCWTVEERQQTLNHYFITLINLWRGQKHKNTLRITNKKIKMKKSFEFVTSELNSIHEWPSSGQRTMNFIS